MKATPRLFALLIALCLLFALLPLQAFAETGGDIGSGSFGDGFSYVYNACHALLILRGEGALPAFSEDDPAPWADEAGQIRRLILEEGITEIPAGAFSACKKLAFPSSRFFTTASTVGDPASLRRLLKDAGVYPTVTRLTENSLANEITAMEDPGCPVDYYYPLEGQFITPALREELKWRAWLDSLNN